MNKWVLKNYSPFIALKNQKPNQTRSFLDFHFSPSYCKVGAQNARKRSC